MNSMAWHLDIARYLMTQCLAYDTGDSAHDMLRDATLTRFGTGAEPRRQGRRGRGRGVAREARGLGDVADRRPPLPPQDHAGRGARPLERSASERGSDARAAAGTVPGLKTENTIAKTGNLRYQRDRQNAKVR